MSTTALAVIMAAHSVNAIAAAAAQPRKDSNMTPIETLAISDILRACAGRLDGSLGPEGFRRRLRDALRELDAAAEPVARADAPDPLGR